MDALPFGIVMGWLSVQLMVDWSVRNVLGVAVIAAATIISSGWYGYREAVFAATGIVVGLIAHVIFRDVLRQSARPRA